MSKVDRLQLEYKKAAFLFDQGRWAEARFKYEQIINELMPKKKAPR